MQFIDILVATGYAAVCISLIVLISPIAPRQTAVDAAEQARLDNALSGYISTVGLPFFTTSSPQTLCQSAVQASNSTFFFDVLIQGEGCSSDGSMAPPLSLGSSSIQLTLPNRQLVVEVSLLKQ